MTDTPIVRIAELEIDPDQINAYIALLREEIEASIAFEPGVLALNAVSLKNNPTSIRLLEIYASEQAYQSHLKTPHFLKYKTLTAEMVMSLQLVETEPLLLRNKAM
jgi:quinol monooxygenase YgiN